MDPTVRLDHFRDGLKSATEREKKWETLTEKEKGFHREQIKFLVRQFAIIEKEMAQFFECGK